jgi:hypothetical protein
MATWALGRLSLFFKLGGQGPQLLWTASTPAGIFFNVVQASRLFFKKE